MDIALDKIDINQCDANVPLFSNANRCKPETTKVRLCQPFVTFPYSRTPSLWANSVKYSLGFSSHSFFFSFNSKRCLLLCAVRLQCRPRVQSGRLRVRVQTRLLLHSESESGCESLARVTSRRTRPAEHCDRRVPCRADVDAIDSVCTGAGARASPGARARRADAADDHCSRGPRRHCGSDDTRCSRGDRRRRRRRRWALGAVLA